MPAGSSRLKLTVYWGDILYDTTLCGPADTITVGRKPDSDYLLDLGPSRDSFELIAMSGNAAELRFDDGIDGHVRFGKEKILSLSAARTTPHVTRDPQGFYRVKLAEADKADVMIGHVSFYLDWVKPDPAQILRKSESGRKRKAMIALAFLLSFFTGTYWLSTMSLPDPEKPPERLVTLITKNTPAKAAMGERKTEDGGAQKGDPGKATVAAPEKPSIAASLRKANLGSLVSGLASLGSNAPATDSALQADAVAPVSQEGTGGFTTEGIKTGAGGKSVGIGRTVGQGRGGFEGTGRLGLSGNSATEGGSGHGSGETVVEGGIDREVIESVIRRRQDRIRLCYERQLNFHPKLAGKIAVHFLIGKTGEVLSATIIEDTMKNAAVSGCIQAEVKSWTFPKPVGGTLVNVDYPFVFESSAAKN